MLVALDVWGREVYALSIDGKIVYEARHDGVIEITYQNAPNLDDVLYSLSGMMPSWYVPPVEE
jgi:hypothetical protein